jgi:hypothetical protein
MCISRKIVFAVLIIKLESFPSTCTCFDKNQRQNTTYQYPDFSTSWISRLPSILQVIPDLLPIFRVNPWTPIAILA